MLIGRISFSLLAMLHAVLVCIVAIIRRMMLLFALWVVMLLCLRPTMSFLESSGDFMKKTRSIYCTESEYQRLKNALTLIRVYDNFGPSAFSGKSFAEESFWKIVKGIDKHD